MHASPLLKRPPRQDSSCKIYWEWLSREDNRFRKRFALDLHFRNMTFTPQPTSADIYLLRFILHDHHDAISLQIVKNLVPAMKNGARLVINDGVLAEPNTLPTIEERISRRV